MKVRISEHYDDEREFRFTKDINEYKKDDPYIVNVDDKKLIKWEKIVAEKTRIDKKWWAVQHMLYDIKVGIDNELVKFICPGCRRGLALERDYIKGGMFHCYRCDCLVGYNWDEKKYYVHSGKGVASINRLFWMNAEEQAQRKSEKNKELINREDKYYETNR